MYSTVLETEISKFICRIIESQVPLLAAQSPTYTDYSTIGNDFYNLCLLNDIVDQTRSNLIRAYRT